MTGYSHIIAIEDLKAKCDSLGFRMGYSTHGYFNKEYGDVVAVFPKDADALPVYSRDAQLFVGSIESLRSWIQGIEWAREYDRMTIGKANDTRRAKREQDWRNEHLVRILKSDDKESK
jgi:hypothetical protein